MFPTYLKPHQLEFKLWPPLFSEIPDPPKNLWLTGTLPPVEFRYLTIVGSRKYSTYGQTVCQKLIAPLAGLPIVIVSGLALGIDGIAHQAALDAGLKTVAIPGSGLDFSVLYPASHRLLAQKIVEAGGTLLSELPPNETPAKHTFPKRNRLMAALAQVVLVIEATDKSGSLITARLALEYNRDVAAVPGPIFSTGHAGGNELIRQGAIPITKADDLAEIFGLSLISTPDRADLELSTDEKFILQQLEKRATKIDDLVVNTGWPVDKIRVLLSMLEIKNLIFLQGDMVNTKLTTSKQS
jgi:DNA processing protein